MGTRRRIGHREVAGLEPGGIVWDHSVVGFGARRQKGATVSYFVFFRTQDGRQRWHTIGRHGAPWVPDTARAEARRLLGAVAGGEDPAAAKQARRHALTMGELCDLYLEAARTGRILTRSNLPKKASTIATDSDRIRAHIGPLLGTLKVAAVTRADIDAFQHGVAARGGRGTARRTTALLSGIFTFAIRQGMRPDNPCRGVQRFAQGRRDRRFSEAEYAQFGAALRAATSVWPPAVAAMRLVAITGFRRGEVLGLRWDEIDLTRRIATLSDTKTGRSIRPLSRPACDLLRGLSRMYESEFVFPARDGRAMSGNSFRKRWQKIAALGDLPPAITPHTLRHSFASEAGDLGYGDSVIAGLLGHARTTMTSRYVHLSDPVLLGAADAATIRIARLMGDVPAEASVIPLRA
jgi:integrase